MWGTCYSCQILTKFEFSRQIFEKKNIHTLDFMKSVQREPSCSIVSNGQTEATKLIIALRNFLNVPKHQFESCQLWIQNMQTSHTKQSTHPLARQLPGCRRSRWHSSLAPGLEYQMTLQEACPLCHQLHRLACQPAPLLRLSEAPCNKHITCHFILLINSGHPLITKGISSQNNTSQQKHSCAALRCWGSITSCHSEISLQWYCFPFQKSYVEKTKVDDLYQGLFGFGKTVI
jgi:hypothetical protein